MLFDQVREMLPKLQIALRAHWITPKIAYLAKTSDNLVVKVDRSVVFVLHADGTYTITDKSGVDELFKEDQRNKKKKGVE